MFCTRASSASIIEKISVEIGIKIEQGWKLSRIEKTCKRAKHEVKARPQPAFSKVTISSFVAATCSATCALFTLAFWSIYLQEFQLDMSKQEHRDFKKQLLVISRCISHQL